MSRAAREKDGPESRTYHRLKGKIIEIWHPQCEPGYPWRGKLVWVDVYTIGVAFDRANPDRVSIVYKDAIRIDYYGEP